MSPGPQTYSAMLGHSARSSGIRETARHGLLSLLGRLSRPAAEPTLRLLYCHHVFDDQRAGFAAAIDYLKTIGDFIDTRKALRVIAGECALTRHAFHMSFDDGSKDVIRNALPVLHEKGVPAIMFVATAVITNPGQFPHLQRLHSQAPKTFAHATWSDLVRARTQGVEIGSHTSLHARLSEISSFEGQMHEAIVGSKNEIERILGSCDYIAWPYGRLSDIDEASISAIQKAGYHACFGAFRGRVIPGVTNRFKIPRHHFEPHWPLSHIRYFAHGGGES